MYVLSGIDETNMATSQTQSRSMPVPSYRTPTGLQSSWRPVAVGFPNTGTSATYIGPRTAAPGLHVGAEAGAVIPEYFPQYSKGRVVRARGTALVETDLRKQAVGGRTATNVVVTMAGPIRLPSGAWLHPFSPALTPGGNL